MAESSTNTMSALYSFQYFIEQDGIANLYSSFEEDCRMLTGRELAGEVEFVYVEVDNDGNHVPHKVAFSTKLNEALRAAYKETVKRISKKVELLNGESDKKSVINTSLDAILFFHERLDEIHCFGQKELIKSWLNKVIKYVHDKYRSTTVIHDSLSLLTQQVHNREDYFGFKLKVRDLQTLYNLLLELKFISDEAQPTDFQDVFTAIEPSSKIQKLKITCKQEEAAYIIQQLKPLFYSLNDDRFVHSNFFQTKQNKPFKYSYFQTARSKFINNPLNSDRIEEVKHLISKYFPQKKKD
jgi:hypothetical protein